MTTTGRYTLGQKIGAGAMGDVFTATDSQTGQTVAIKQLKTDLAQRDPAILERFRREGEALRALDHPNIVKMLEALSEGDRHTIVMEYVAGGDLASLLAERGPLPIDEALGIAIQLADALTRSHFLDIIHRDIKPANILITTEGVPKLTDFGIAHFARAEDSPTATGMVIGTYAYLSPEACMGIPLDGRSDIWAFGVVLYEMLTGQRPFDGSSPGALVIGILQKPFPDPQELRPDIPDALNDLLYRTLTKQREARIPSIRLVGAEIEALLKGHSLPRKVAVSTAPPETVALPDFHTPTSQKTASHNLPHQTTPFVGRTTEMTELQRLLGEADKRLITLHGPGGMGKSRLATEAAHTRLAAYADGVYFVELAPLSDAATIPHAIGEAAGYPFSGPQPPAAQIVTFLANKTMLLILDNFEHILEGRSLVTDILKAAPGVTILTTSRERLNLTGETVFTLGGMDFPAWETPEDALNYSAVKLFMQAAERARVDFELTEGDLNHLARICKLVQGTPLGIILAAGWADTLPLEDIASELAEGVDLLETEMTDLPERQRSIRAAFEYSWALLTDDERDAFARLSVFRGSCTYKAAKTVANANLRMLTTLANKSLLGRNPTSGRFEIHELLRQLAAEHLAQSGEGEAIRDKHAAYYLTALAAREDDLKGADQLGAATTLDADFENIRAGWYQALATGDYPSLLDAFFALMYLCAVRGRLTDAITMSQAVIAQVTEHDTPQLWARAILLHDIITRQVHPDKLNQYEKALTLAQQANDAYTTSLAHTALGWGLGNMGRLEESLAQYQQALDFAQAQGDAFAKAESLHRIGLTYVRMGRIKEAYDTTRQAADLRRANGDLLGLVNSVNNLGTISGYFRDFDKAGAHYEEAAEVSHQLGDLISEALVSGNLAFHYVRAGLEEEAERLIATTLRIAERVNIPSIVENASIARVALALRRGDYARVEELAATQGEIRNPQVAAAVTTMRSIAAIERGQIEQAKGYIRQSITINPDTQAPSKSPPLRAIAQLAERAGDRERAVALTSLHYQYAMMASPEAEFSKPLLDMCARLKAELGEEAYNAAWERGKKMDIHTEYERAVADYLSEQA